MKQILFFALRNDVMSLLERFDSMGAVKYVESGVISTPSCSSFDRGASIPDLGRASNPSAINCQTFLICTSSTEIRLRPLADVDCRIRFAVDQLENPDTVMFSSGGLWNNSILLHGRTSTVSQSKLSQELMRRFQRALIKVDFQKVKAYYVGPDAMEFLKNGQRLSTSAQSPREFDLSL
jgi:hypothetical protein